MARRTQTYAIRLAVEGGGARLVGEGARPPQRSLGLPGLCAGRGRDLRLDRFENATGAHGGGFGADRGA